MQAVPDVYKRQRRYNLMKIYVGIDIAKLNHFAAAISSDGEIIIEPVSYTQLDVYKRQPQDAGCHRRS